MKALSTSRSAESVRKRACAAMTPVDTHDRAIVAGHTRQGGLLAARSNTVPNQRSDAVWPRARRWWTSQARGRAGLNENLEITSVVELGASIAIVNAAYAWTDSLHTH